MSNVSQTAFHASFTNTSDADDKVLKVSRGTSVVSTAGCSTTSVMLISSGIAPRVRNVSALPTEVPRIHVPKHSPKSD